MKTINTYWFVSRVYGDNFGDMLTPELMKRYGVSATYNPQPITSSLVVVGSILDLVPTNYTGTILGSGFILPDTKHTYENATVASVRGKLTKRNIGITKDIPLGDPGLLCRDLLPIQKVKKFKVGIIPHFQDKNNKAVKALVAKHKDVKFIDVQRQPNAVIADMDECEYILSSSLHGLVCADGLNIPSGWVKLSNLLKGGEFKFQDYYSALDTNGIPHSVTGRESVEDLIKMTRKPADTLETVIPELKETFINTITAMEK